MIPPKAPKTCERCGVTYMPTGTRQKYCRECGAIIQAKLKRAYVRAHPKKQKYKKPSSDRIVKKPDLTIAQAVKESREVGMSYGNYISLISIYGREKVLNLKSSSLKSQKSMRK